MSSEFGRLIHIQLFGESHGAAVGGALDGLPAGEAVDLKELAEYTARRRPGGELVSARKEADEIRILSGLTRGRTNGAPLAFYIENTDANHDAYDGELRVPRPSHADWCNYVKFGGFSDVRGGGHSSGRLTAPLCAAGGICEQILSRLGITVGAHILSIGRISDELFDGVGVDKEILKGLRGMHLPTLNAETGEKMAQLVRETAERGDSIGGVIECAVLGLPCGVGEPMFDGLKSALARVLFGIPAVTGVEFGRGFDAAKSTGSENNDAFILRDGRVVTETNRCGGVLGGMATGMPLIFRVAVKPTPSIALPQKSVDITENRETTVNIKGRHDACIALRALPVFEAAASCVLLDMALLAKTRRL